MAQETSESSTVKPALWLPRIKTELDRIESSGSSKAAAPYIMDAVCRELIFNGMLQDFDQLQYYLLARDSPALLYAQPYNSAPNQDEACVDARTRKEPRPYVISVKSAERVRQLLGEASISKEGHAMMLSQLTGIRVPKNGTSTSR